MSDPRFVAAFWCADGPSVFGNKEKIDWKWDAATTDDGLDQLRVAQVHHDLVCRLRSALRSRHWTIDDYAREVGYSRDRMGKLMRGTAVLRLEDIAAMERLFELPFLPQTVQRAPTNADA